MTTTIVTGWLLTTITITVNPSVKMNIHTEQRDVPYLAQDLCVKDEGLSLLTGKRETDTENGRIVELCTPVLEEVSHAN